MKWLSKKWKKFLDWLFKDLYKLGGTQNGQKEKR